MKKILLVALFAIILFPTSSSFSQFTDTPSTFGIILSDLNPYHFKDENGYTIVIGEVENTTNSPIKAVKILALFFDDFSEQPLEAALGTTIVDIIPPLGKVPYIIKSENPNAAITSVSVKLQGQFDSAPPKNEELRVESEISEFGEQIKISGTLTNNAIVNATQTKIHLAFYDAFLPPRIIWISTIELEEAIMGGSSIDFEFDEKLDPRSFGYKIFAESDTYYSNIQNVKILRSELLTKLVSINDISVSDDEGNKLLDIFEDSVVNIQSRISLQYATDQETYEQPYVYYAQVKESETAKVEFLGIYEGMFDEKGNELTSVEWIPQNKGLFFIETYVWDPNAVPLASKGPIMLVLVT
jgi:hypothetical protein